MQNLDGPGEQRRCEACGELNPARAKFCLECGTRFELELVDRLPQANGTTGERRVVSVLFADLSGFTAYSEGSDVEDVRAIAQEAAERLGDIVVKHGGTVDKIIGDCVMAVFGAPVAHEDDAERAVRTALEMQAAVKEHQQRFAGLTLCVGVNTGEAMWAPVGNDGYTVLGDTVNTAARLQGAAAKGAVVIGQATFDAVADAIECDALEPIKAKNKAEPVPAWHAVAVKGERQRAKAVRASLVGRDAELTRLRELWERVRTERDPYAAVILGSPGVGKSRLISTLTDEIGSSALVLRGHCLPYGEGITYWPVVEIIQQVAGINHDDDTETVSHKLGALLESLGMDDLDELRTIAVALANLIGAPTTPRGTYTATEISRGELHWGLRRILQLGARNLPLVLIIEDLHWAEPALLELIDYIFAGSEAAILGLGSARPEIKETDAIVLQPRPNRRVLQLDPLDEEQSAKIVAELLGEAGVSDAGIAKLLRSAGGNPLFLEEVIQMWRESGDGNLADLAIPNELHGLIGSRLDRLPEDQRRVVSRAAVIGDVFWLGALSSITGGNSNVADALDALESRDIIRRQPASTITGESEYGFKHGLIRDVAYTRLTKAERTELHERCGNWITNLPGGEQEFAEIVAYHLEQACRLAAELRQAGRNPPTLAAAQALHRAGRRAEAREGMREAERFLSRALELLGERFPETSIELQLRHSRMTAGLGDLKPAYEELERTAEAAERAGRLDIRCEALAALAEVDLSLGNGARARPRIDEASELARRLDDPRLRIQVAHVRGALRQEVDNARDEAVEDLLAAAALADEIEDHKLRLRSHMRLGVVYFNSGRLHAAQVEFEQGLDVAAERGSLRDQSWLSACLGLIRYHCGLRDEAEDLFKRASDWMERTSDLYMRVQTLVWHGVLELRRNNLRNAVRLLRIAMSESRDIGGFLVAHVGRYLAEALARQERVREVRELAAEVRELGLADDALAEAGVLIADAFAAAAAHDGSTARNRLDRALQRLETQEDQIELGDALLAYAVLLEMLGEPNAAVDKLYEAKEVFRGVVALATVAQIDNELTRLHSLAEPEATITSA